jgi:hypothetical protein
VRRLFQYPIRWLAPPAEDVSASGLKDRRFYVARRARHGWKTTSTRNWKALRQRPTLLGEIEETIPRLTSFSIAL